MITPMNQDLAESEFCAVCGKDANGDRWFCHFYTDERHDTLCSPACAEVFLHRNGDPNRAEKSAPPGEGAMAIQIM